MTSRAHGGLMHNVISLRGQRFVGESKWSAESPTGAQGRPLTYTVEQVADMLRISRSTAYRCVESGEIPCLRLRRRIVVPAAAIDAMLAGTAPLPVPSTGQPAHLR